jgi:hypothetical protein
MKQSPKAFSRPKFQFASAKLNKITGFKIQKRCIANMLNLGSLALIQSGAAFEAPKRDFRSRTHGGPSQPSIYTPIFWRTGRRFNIIAVQ